MGRNTPTIQPPPLWDPCPLTDLTADPAAWHNLAEIIRTVPDDVAAYKSMLAARDPLTQRMRDFR